jgi:hypothetical protein
MANRVGPIADAARVVRFWHAVEIFSPQAVPARDAGQHFVDHAPGPFRTTHLGGRNA